MQAKRDGGKTELGNKDMTWTWQDIDVKVPCKVYGLKGNCKRRVLRHSHVRVLHEHITVVPFIGLA